MTLDTALDVVRLLDDWNVGQKVFDKDEQEICDLKRKALKKAWSVIGGPEHKSQSTQ